MTNFEIKMPKMGESIEEATITKWFVKENDLIEEDQILFEIATDKVDSEIPSPVSGRVEKILFHENDKVQVGTVLAIIDQSGKPATVTNKPVISEKPDLKKETTNTPREEKKASKMQEKEEIRETRFYSPLVKSIALKEKINLSELESVKGTGIDNRVKKVDILNYIENKSHKVGASVEKTLKADADIPKSVIKTNEGDEIIEMDRMRRLMAEHMVMSKRVSPHVTNVLETDVTNLVLWREKMKSIIEKREGIKLTYMPVIIDAVTKAIKEYPMVNASVDGTKMIIRKAINIGVAVALPTGNLIVPVIKNTDQKSILGIAEDLSKLADNARNNRLSPDDIANGTFTITNFGSVHGLFGTPIIHQPQVAILGTGKIQKKPAVLETLTGDVIAIRHMMYLSLTYDHRIIDGAMSGVFLKKISDYLENWDINMSI
jgi:2-oxoglutarate dehydrogenase E2 component (dihydrolipoamide succinyltransferase)